MRRIVRTACLALTLAWGISLHAQELHKEQDSSLNPVGLSLTDEISIQPYKLSLTDSLAVAQASEQAVKVAQPWQPKSGKALLWALIPGGGQIYNRKYWKLPIVWGALATCVYFIDFNSRLYKEYHAAYRDIMSEDPSTNTAWLAYAPRGARAEDYQQYSYLSATLQRGNDYYRRYRDLSVVLTIAVYGLSILDAYVDAELFTFDISPDLSMRVSPMVLPALPNQQINSPQVGMSCQFTF